MVGRRLDDEADETEPDWIAAVAGQVDGVDEVGTADDESVEDLYARREGGAR